MNAQDDVARSPSPVSEAEFAACLSSFDPGRSVAVAFSGGPDSLALLVLAARWAARRKNTVLHAFTVDHGLRAASGREAKEAARLSAALGVPHRILKWKGEKPSTGIQAAAREARYGLLFAACRDVGANDLLVAHHLEDQAETFLLRLSRGSGIDGLAAMPASRPLRDDDRALRLLRPLLDLPRARLLATVAKSRLTPIQDPSNENERFDRVKARKALSILAPLGLDAARLARTAAQMGRAREALEAETARLLAGQASYSAFGFAEMKAEALIGAPAEIGLRALAALIRAAGGGRYAPRLVQLEAVHAAIGAGALGRGRTLGGVKLALKGGILIVSREVAAAQGAAPLLLRQGEEGIWDGRFRLRLDRAPRGRRFEVRALGSEGLAALRATQTGLPEVPSAILQALPGLWLSDKLAAAPHLGTLRRGVEVRVALRRMPWPDIGKGAEKA
ncbi:MAG: tRNA lysidine(34) synthetase TilS [Parvibaculum sp.]|uniref:tRNA lysidine(34) synthetase TilS n=1 Tax=Parvibaculum sp. TaxID=2024848 RepID=UPI002ABA73FE|nr:tRNA lysidine(34) synthetase TilS [Parvibaculum sp.]MDZ4380216.1 tRNA lysidine(34) synthetase TilS [Parvibaculum sp.]